MFTGLVLEVGRVAGLSRSAGKVAIEVEAPKLASGFAIGDSVAIDGVCQTVTHRSEQSFTVEALAETMKKTTLGGLTRGAYVNLEPAVTASTPLGGHFVQGHVNGTGTVLAVEREYENVYMRVELPPDLVRYCVPEGSIAIDGVSLTIARLADAVITVNVIPHTWEHTALRERAAGDAVNLETDIIARYVERFMAPHHGANRGPSAEQLRAWGY